MKHTLTAAVALLALTPLAANAAWLNHGTIKVDLLPPPACVLTTQPSVTPWGKVYSGAVGSGYILPGNVWSEDPFNDFPAFKGVTPYIAAVSTDPKNPTEVQYDLAAPTNKITFTAGYVDAKNHFHTYMVAPDGSEVKTGDFDGKEFARKFGAQDLHTSNHIQVTTPQPFNQVRFSVRNLPSGPYENFEFAFDKATCN